MKINGIVETALHVEDVARSAEFYESLFGLHRLASDDRFCAFAVPGDAVLLLFRKAERSSQFRFPVGRFLRTMDRAECTSPSRSPRMRSNRANVSS